MKAAYIDYTGSAQHIRYGDFPTPVIGKRDVLVKVIAVTVDGGYTYIRSGRFQTHIPLPFIIGRDMTGEVVVRISCTEHSKHDEQTFHIQP